MNTSNPPVSQSFSFSIRVIRESLNIFFDTEKRFALDAYALCTDLQTLFSPESRTLRQQMNRLTKRGEAELIRDQLSRFRKQLKAFEKKQAPQNAGSFQRGLSKLLEAEVQEIELELEAAFPPSHERLIKIEETRREADKDRKRLLEAADDIKSEQLKNQMLQLAKDYCKERRISPAG